LVDPSGMTTVRGWKGLRVMALAMEERGINLESIYPRSKL
jgi:hypothetical protein